MTVSNIIVLGNDRNQKGDLFNRLVFDVFHVLGFKEPQYNIHKSGRELDITVRHRTEQKIAIVESKAHEDKVGGDEINKFADAHGYTTGEWFNGYVWEYCLFDWQNGYNDLWRIRPIYILNLRTGLAQHIRGGMQHWLFYKGVMDNLFG